MARKPARRTTYRKAPARRGYGARSRTGTRARSRVGARSSSSRQQTVKVVVEMVPPSAIARPEGGPLQTVAAPPKQSKF